MAAAGRLLASNAIPSATADALHEPQSPTPVMMTSQPAAISLISSSGAGWAKLTLVRAMRSVAPYRSISSRPTSSRNGAAFCLVFTSRPTVAPLRLAGRRARGAFGRAVLVVVVVPVGSRMTFGGPGVVPRVGGVGMVTGPLSARG